MKKQQLDVTVTPKMAAKWLDENNNSNPRPIAPGTVRKYIMDLKKGNWPNVDEPIVFDENGELMNGQHRLKACDESDISFVSNIITGAPSSNAPFIDSGRKRTAAQMITGEGQKYGAAKSSTLKFLAAVEGPKLEFTNVTRGVYWPTASTHELMACKDRWPEVDYYMSLVQSASQGTGKTVPVPSHLAVICQVARTENSEFIDDWLEKIRTGDTAIYDPARIIREHFMVAKRKKTGQLVQANLYELFVRGMNAYLQDEPWHSGIHLSPKQDIPAVLGYERWS